ncbi:hypothetical protein CEXT_752951 [Caerostris extrusa]|uniref:Uncharacterized protein n=1 Tax=Caerostris extrusa TaxID=172846 RepID=A0AAV4TIN8_CAEEX|nr:hypothetical protein CEXT_752951 [Caerostris extrusa]
MQSTNNKNSKQSLDVLKWILQTKSSNFLHFLQKSGIHSAFCFTSFKYQGLKDSRLKYSTSLSQTRSVVLLCPRCFPCSEFSDIAAFSVISTELWGGIKSNIFRPISRASPCSIENPDGSRMAEGIMRPVAFHNLCALAPLRPANMQCPDVTHSGLSNGFFTPQQRVALSCRSSVVANIFLKQLNGR